MALMRARVLLFVWVAVTAGWCWRWAYVWWPEMRLALFLGAALGIYGAATAAEAWRRRG